MVTVLYHSFRRNMSGSLKKDDPAEIRVSGDLYQIKIGISKGDYSVLMAILTENFGEKGAFETVSTAPKSGAMDRSALTLPVKSKYNGSRTSIASTNSLLEAMKATPRDPECKAVEFKFILHGLWVNYFQYKFDEKSRNADQYLLLFDVCLISF